MNYSFCYFNTASPLCLFTRKSSTRFNRMGDDTNSEGILVSALAPKIHFSEANLLIWGANFALATLSLNSYVESSVLKLNNIVVFWKCRSLLSIMDDFLYFTKIQQKHAQHRTNWALQIADENLKLNTEPASV